MTEGLSRKERRALASQMRKEARQNKKLLKTARTIVDNSNVRQGWIPKGEVLQFAGRSIPGMVYFGIPEKYYCSFHDEDHDSSVYIDPRKEVLAPYAPRYNDGVVESHYYEHWNPGIRANYLDWLANGKCRSDCNPAYPLLYFYGLERRYYFDNPDEHEKGEIFEEVIRLYDLYGDYEKFHDDAEHFLDSVNDHTAEIKTMVPEKVLKFFTFFNEAMTSYFDGGESLTFDSMDCLHFVKEAKKSGFCNLKLNDKWFEQLYLIRFDEKFPNGIQIEKPNTAIQSTYVAASGEFVKKIPLMLKGMPVYEYEKLATAFDEILEFCENLERELGHYFSYIRQNPNSADSFNAVKLLPYELWCEFEHLGLKIEEHFNHLTSWAWNLAEQGLSVPASNIDMDYNFGIWRRKLHGMHCTDLRKPLALCGFGAAPDYWLRFRNAKPDDPVFIYEFDISEKRIAPSSEAYQSALTEISVGAYVLQTEKRDAEETRNILTNMISKRTGLTENERRGLKANLKCILELPHDRGFLRRLEVGINTDWIDGVTRFLVDLAHVDRIVHKRTVSVIEKVYAKLGLDPAQAYSDLHAGTTASGSNRKTGDGFNVTELDESRIESIRTDTEEVSKVLGGIFTDEDNAREVPVEDGQIVFKGLDIKHTTFLQKLLDREHWTLDEFEKLARNHGLLPVGAVETINEWMFEKFEEPLLDEQDGYHVAQNIAENLVSELETLN